MKESHSLAYCWKALKGQGWGTEGGKEHGSHDFAMQICMLHAKPSLGMTWQSQRVGSTTPHLKVGTREAEDLQAIYHLL